MKLKTNPKEGNGKKVEKKEKEKILDMPSEPALTEEYDWQDWEGEKLNINHSIRHRVGFWGGFYRIFRTFFVLIERSVKTVAVFILTISASILFLVASFYLFASSFNLKDSPAFQTLRDRIGILYASHIEDEIQEAERRMDKEKEWELKNLREDILEGATTKSTNNEGVNQE